MKISAKAVLAGLLRVASLFGRSNWTLAYTGEDAPLRSELFSADQMQQYGKTLAASHVLGSRQRQDLLLSRLAENERLLLEACNLLTAAIRTDRAITPAGTWLLDNFYLIEEQIRTARRHLPADYSSKLPRLGSGPSAGLPRVYDIALKVISHGDGRVDPDSLSRFIAAYQTVAPLSLGELWGVPIMLRLALIENLRRVAARIIVHRIGRDIADFWAGQMMETAQKDPKSLILVIADMARSNPPMSSSFVAEIARRLQGQSPALSMPLNWIEQRLAELGLSIEQLVQSENQQQAADQVSISNSIGSLRFLAATDWHKFVEKLSVTERILREDPAGAYAAMDFDTRDSYRHVVEKLSKESGTPEDRIARLCVDLAGEQASLEPTPRSEAREAHVGYYLIGPGLPQLEALAGPRVSAIASFVASARRVVARTPLRFYLGPIALLTAALAGAMIAQARADGATGWLLFLAGTLGAIAASQLAVSLVNWGVTLLAMPRPLPRMDFTKGIPASSRTLVVVPTMLFNADNVEELVEALEVRFLGNRDDNLLYGLLTDFTDAPEQTLPEDEPLLRLASQRIAELNRKYRRDTGDDGNGGGDIFFLLHRPRRWNARERVWMGYERKRGKLAALNGLLRGGDTTPFSLIVGQVQHLSGIQYVITLDTDTQLPRDAAQELVGAMAHPLNRPHYDQELRRVTEGYGILQPRVAVSLPEANRSHYARLHGEEPGIDPYTRTVSDVYQDLFGEGSFIGKGIYDVDAFEHSLKDRFPENRILSHDLLEGCHARAGLISDVQLYEEFPARYSADFRRRHRWIRGDWQIGAWLNRRVPGRDGRPEPNSLSPLSQWKIFDNLRRSLVSASLTLLLLVGWAFFSAPYWTLAVAAIVLVPAVLASLLEYVRKPDDALLAQHMVTATHSAARRLLQGLFALTTLPFDAWFSLGAVLKTAFRMLVTKRHLLEWQAFGLMNHTRKEGSGIGASLRSMWIAPALSLAAMAYLAEARPESLPAAMPLLLLWLASPLAAWWVSKPIARRDAGPTRAQTLFLRMVSRKTWSFFERFVGPEDQWLPPDNFQEVPRPVIAHRTSPTNIGLSLLSNLTAYDFGYITAGTLLERTRNTFDTLQRLERYHGHFYNWYDTQTLQPLLPVYISTVDSGNLSGHLLTLRPGLLALADQKILAGRWLEGLEDTLGVLLEAANSAPSSPAAAVTALEQFQEEVGSPGTELEFAL